MKMRNLYLALFIVGTVVPYYYFVLFLIDHGWNYHLLVTQMFSNHISSFLSWDVIISAVVLLLFIFSDISRETIKYLWISIIATIFIGVSSGLPLFLYLRECCIDEN